MKTTVKFLSSSRTDLDRWRDSLQLEGKQELKVARIFMDSVTDHLAATSGRFPEAIPIRGVRPRSFLWQFHSGWWLRYVIQDKGWWLFGSRKITVVQVVQSRSIPFRVGEH